jgi:two-component system sensor histidine kinase HydH
MRLYGEWKRVVLVTTLITAVLCLNYFTLYGGGYQHAFYRMLFYLPLFLGSFWFGIKGALYITISVMVLYVPYVMDHWHGFSLEDFHEILEGVLFLVIALTLGVLVKWDRKRQKAVLETTSLAAIGRAVFEVAHDMKTPLMAIGGFATQVSRELGQDDPKQKKLNVVIQETARLEAMIREMLDFGRPLEMRIKEANLNDLVRESIGVVRPITENTGVELKTDLEGSLPLLLVDAQKVKQVLLNLLTNALEVSPGGSSIIVKTVKDHDWVKLLVIDSGLGIDEKDGKNIFKPFFTKKGRGTGLGLPIVKKIVEAHEGDVCFDPNVEKGVTFTVRFPVRPVGGSEARSITQPALLARGSGMLTRSFTGALSKEE